MATNEGRIRAPDSRGAHRLHGAPFRNYLFDAHGEMVGVCETSTRLTAGATVIPSAHANPQRWRVQSVCGCAATVAPEEADAGFRRTATSREIDAWTRSVRASEGGGMSSMDMWTYEGQGWRADVTGYDVEALDGGIGSVDEATDEVGASYIVVDTGPWIFGKKVVLPAGVVESIDHDDEKIFVNRTKDEIKNAPEFGESTYREAAYRGELARYYGTGGSAHREPAYSDRRTVA